MVDLNPGTLYGKGLSATDVSNALGLQNLILPTGTVKVGTREYLIQLNSSPDLVSGLNDVPIKTVNGGTIFMRDVANVRDGYAVQTNVVRQDGQRGVFGSRNAHFSLEGHAPLDLQLVHVTSALTLRVSTLRWTARVSHFPCARRALDR